MIILLIYAKITSLERFLPIANRLNFGNLLTPSVACTLAFLDPEPHPCSIAGNGEPTFDIFNKIKGAKYPESPQIKLNLYSLSNLIEMRLMACSNCLPNGGINWFLPL